MLYPVNLLILKQQRIISARVIDKTSSIFICVDLDRKHVFIIKSMNATATFTEWDCIQ